MKQTLLLLWFASITLYASDRYILIDLSAQRAYAYEDGSVRFSGRISSGKKGRETPAGEYHILEKERYHISNLWPRPHGGAKMPYMLRLSNDGIAMHLGHVPHYPASHGCVRMQNGFAQKMYRWAKVGMLVLIEGSGAEYMAWKHAKRYRGSSRGYDENYGIVDIHD